MILGRARVGALIGVVAVGGVLSIGLADCAEPTQIELDIRTDACGVLKNAGIAVTTPDRIDSEPLKIFTPDRPDNGGCEGKPSDRVGTLIIYPSGDKDAEIGIRIVGGVSRTVQECKQGDYAGCIVARRIERFAEGSTKKVIVILSRACEGKDCGVGKECNQSGTCVVNLADGGTEDAGTPDADIVPDSSTDAPLDAPPDVFEAGVDACVGCTGAGTTCNAGQCNVDCAAAGAGACANKAACAPDLDCTFNCNATNACQNVTCAPSAKSCTFDCTSGDPACNSITCSGPSCVVRCSQAGKCDGDMVLTGGDAGLTCNGSQSCPAVDSITCDAGRCLLSCSGSCPNNKNCLSPLPSCVGGSW